MAMTAGVNGTRRGCAVRTIRPPLFAPGAVEPERLLDAVGRAVMATDLDGSIIYWNAHAGQMYGWTASEVLGRNIMDVVVSEDLRESAATSSALSAAGRRGRASSGWSTATVAGFPPW